MSELFKRLNASLENYDEPELPEYTEEEVEDAFYEEETPDDEAGIEVERINLDLEKLEETEDALEYYQDALEHFSENDGVHPQAISMMRGHLYGAMRAMNINVGVGNESFDDNSTAALESVKTAAEKVWEWIKEMFKKLGQAATAFWNAVSLKRIRLDKKLDSLATGLLTEISGTCDKKVSYANKHMFLNGAILRGELATRKLDKYVKDFSAFYKAASFNYLASKVKQAAIKEESANSGAGKGDTKAALFEAVYNDVSQTIRQLPRPIKTNSGHMAAMELPGDMVLIVDVDESKVNDGNQDAIKQMAKALRVHASHNGSAAPKATELNVRSVADLQRDVKELRGLLKKENDAAKVVLQEIGSVKLKTLGDTLTNKNQQIIAVFARMMRQVMASPVPMRTTFLSCISAQVNAIYKEAKLYDTKK